MIIRATEGERYAQREDEGVVIWDVGRSYCHPQPPPGPNPNLIGEQLIGELDQEEEPLHVAAKAVQVQARCTPSRRIASEGDGSR